MMIMMIAQNILIPWREQQTVLEPSSFAFEDTMIISGIEITDLQVWDDSKSSTYTKFPICIINHPQDARSSANRNFLSQFHNHTCSAYEDKENVTKTEIKGKFLIFTGHNVLNPWGRTALGLVRHSRQETWNLKG
jgi:hypothetical protein